MALGSLRDGRIVYEPVNACILLVAQLAALLVEQSFHAAAKLATRAFVMRHGRIVGALDEQRRGRGEGERVPDRAVDARQAVAGDGFHLRFRPVLNLMGEPIQLYDTSLQMENNGEMVGPATFSSARSSEETGTVMLLPWRETGSGT